MSISLGEHDSKKAHSAMNNSILLLVLLSVIITAVLLAVKKPLLMLLGCSDLMYPLADPYCTIYTLGTPAVLCGVGLNRFVSIHFAFVDGFTAMGMIKEAIPISFVRKTLYITAVLLLPRIRPLENIFYACAISDIAGATFTAIVFFTLLRPRLLRKLRLSESV